MPKTYCKTCSAYQNGINNKQSQNLARSSPSISKLLSDSEPDSVSESQGEAKEGRLDKSESPELSSLKISSSSLQSSLLSFLRTGRESSSDNLQSES